MGWIDKDGCYYCEGCEATWLRAGEVLCQCPGEDISEDVEVEQETKFSLPAPGENLEESVARILAPDGSGIMAELALALIEAKQDESWGEAKKAEVINKICGTLLKRLEAQQESSELKSLKERLRKLEEG